MKRSHVVFALIAVPLHLSCQPRSFNSISSAKTSLDISQGADCGTYIESLRKANLEITTQYSCDLPQSCLVVWKDNNANIAGFVDGEKKFAVEWEWHPYEAKAGWNVESVTHKTEGWMFTDDTHWCAGIVHYAFVDILEDGSLVVKATRETNRAAICPVKKIFSTSLAKCKKVEK